MKTIPGAPHGVTNHRHARLRTIACRALIIAGVLFTFGLLATLAWRMIESDYEPQTARALVQGIVMTVVLLSFLVLPRDRK